MKALLCIRGDYIRNYSGDSAQFIKTVEFLKKLGVDVEVNSGKITDFSSYDIVHLFNLTRMWETYDYYKRAKFYKKVIVMSPVYWELKMYYKYMNNYERIRIWESSKVYREKMLKGCSMIYVSSITERDNLIKEYGEYFKYSLILSGVEGVNEEIPLYNFKERYNLDNYIICSERICEKSNQLVLCKVCSELGITLVLTGFIAEKEYHKKCMEFKNVVYIPFDDRYNLFNAYKFAKLYVCTNFMDVNCINTLEAAVAGCNIVCTKEGSAREYFGDKALYCSPYDESSIRSAIEVGLKKPKDGILKEYVKERYNWSKEVEKLFKSYNSLIHNI
jgi:glycosyltransferase involved in cell wall biosynthesis